MQRHGPLVLNVCRRLLHQEQDAEDVFQATFLLLARKAGSIRWRDTVAPWLHAAAHRLALKARAEAMRRRRQEAEAARRRAASPGDDLSWREAAAILEEELGRMPERYRAPLLLCCWEGKARDEAARLLGWTAGAVKGRLERGRQLLRKRLVRRGVTLPAGLMAVGLARGGVPAALAGSTVRLAVAAISGTAGVIPPAVATLTGVGLRATKAKVVGLLLVLVTLVAGAGVWTRHNLGGGTTEEVRKDEASTPSTPDANNAKKVAAAPPLSPETKPPEKPPEEKPPAPLPWPREDANGNLLPPGAAQRFGSPRIRLAAPARAVLLSPDGTMLATAGGSADPFIRLWDAAKSKELRRWKGTVASLAFSPDGTLLAGLDGGKPFRSIPVRVWNTKTGDLVLETAKPAIEQGELLTFTPDGNRLCVIGNHYVYAWGMNTGKRPLLTIKLGDPTASAVATGPGSKKELLAIAVPSAIHVYDARTGNVQYIVRSDGAEFTALTFGDNYLAAGTKIGDLHLWDKDSGKLMWTWHDPTRYPFEALTVAVSDKGPRLMGICADRDGCEVRLWDPKTGKEPTRIKLESLPRDRRNGQRLAASLSGDGKRLAVVDEGGHHVRFWDTTTGKELFVPEGGASAVRQVALLPDGKTIAAASSAGTHLWTIGSDKPPRRRHLIRSGYQCGCLTRWYNDGRPIPGSIQVWESASGKIIRKLDSTEDVFSLALGPDGKALVLGHRSGSAATRTGRQDPAPPWGGIGHHHRAGVFRRRQAASTGSIRCYPNLGCGQGDKSTVAEQSSRSPRGNPGFRSGGPGAGGVRRAGG